MLILLAGQTNFDNNRTILSPTTKANYDVFESFYVILFWAPATRILSMKEGQSSQWYASSPVLRRHLHRCLFRSTNQRTGLTRARRQDDITGCERVLFVRDANEAIQSMGKLCKMADTKLLLVQISTIIRSKSFSKTETNEKLDEIGTLITKKINSMKASGNKHIVQDDFAALQLPKSEMARAPEDLMPARYCEILSCLSTLSLWSVHVLYFAAGP